MISIQKMVDALAGRRIAVTAGQDDARRELKACAAQLAQAQAQIAEQGREIALLQNDLTIAVQAACRERSEAGRQRSEAASLRAASQRLMRIADGREAAERQTPAVSDPDEQLQRQAEQDRRNAIAMQDRILELEGRLAGPEGRSVYTRAASV